MKRILFFCIFLFLFVLNSTIVFGQNEDDILDKSQQQLQPQSIQDAQEEDQSFIARVCRIIQINLICPGKKINNIFAPSASLKTSDENKASDTDLQQTYDELSALDSALEDVAGTSSAQVLAESDSFLKKILSPFGLFVDKETAFTTRHVWPASLDLGDDPDKAVGKKMARGILMPASMQEAGSVQYSPTSTPTIINSTYNNTVPIEGEVVGTTCSLGTDACSIANMRDYFSTIDGADQASVICKKENPSEDPVVINNGCQLPGTPQYAMDYSVGLFQINMMDYCSSKLLKKYSSSGYSGPDFKPQDVFLYSGFTPVMPCVVLDQEKLDLCEQAMLKEENNIQYAVDLSGDAVDWTNWSTANVCSIEAGKQVIKRTITPYPGSNFSNENYTVYYQNDPVYASIPLPSQSSCINRIGTYINAACGPFTALNALVNNGVSMTPQQLINGYYQNLSCSGSGIEHGRNVLKRFNIGVPEGEQTYLFTQYGAPHFDQITGYYFLPQEVLYEFRTQTAAGWTVWAVADFYNSTSNRWIGHHFLIIAVTQDNRILTLDPYYGFGKSIPFDQTGYTIRYKAAFKFRKL